MRGAPHWTLSILVCLGACSGNGGAESKAEAVEPAEVAAAAGGGDATPVPTKATAIVTKLPTLDASKVTPYFTEGVAGDAAKLFALEKWDEAIVLFRKALKAEKDKEMAARLRLLVAVTEAERGKSKIAADLFSKSATAVPRAADYANGRAAELYYEVGDFDKARAHAAQVSKTSIHIKDATLLLADVHRKKKEWKKAAAIYDAYLDGDNDGHRLAEARFRRAQVYEQLGKPALEVGLLYKEVTTKSVLTSWGQRAEERTKALASRVRSADRSKLTVLDAAERIHRGETYYRNMRNELSFTEFDEALKAKGLDAEMRCNAAFHRANSVYKQRDRKKAAPLFEEAIAACNKSKNKDLQVKSYYQAGRCYGLTARSELAIKRYQMIEKKHPTHSYADDARLRSAEEFRDLKNQKKVTEYLSTIPKKYPKGDMRAEAMWRLAWRAYKDKKYDESIKWLKKQIKVKPIDENYWAEGQAQYWLGRAYMEKGQKKVALGHYADAIKLYPLSYYALLAFNRIREVDEKLYKKLVAEVAKAPKEPKDKKAFDFKPREVYGNKDFLSAIELLRLGLGRDAQRQLSALGFVVPEGKKVEPDKDKQDKIWAMALLNHQAGRFSRSHWVTRWHVVDFKRKWPVGTNKERWRIAYPIAWWELLSRHASNNGYPVELQIAFVREESAFNPLQESFANAIGLTQMIFPTAKRFAKGTDIKVSRATLRDPEKNVTIGGRFLKFLYERFDGRVALVVPSYNAGEGATDRWLRYRPDWDMDAWAEEIPFDETRRYSKRVLATYFTYSYLATGDIPVMPNDIPKAAIKRAKR